MLLELTSSLADAFGLAVPIPTCAEQNIGIVPRKKVNKFKLNFINAGGKGRYLIQKLLKYHDWFLKISGYPNSMFLDIFLKF